MKLSKKRGLKITVVFLISVLLLAGCVKVGTNKQGGNMGEDKNTQLKDFTLMDTEGNEVKLSDYKGKKLYIKFWASWCSICLDTLEESDKLAGKNKDYEIISVVSTGFAGEKNEEDFKNWYKSLGYKNLKVLMDTDGGTLVKPLNIEAYPTSAYIGSDGKLAKLVLGYQSEEQIDKTMEGIQ